MRNQKDTPEAPDLYKKQMHQKVRYSGGMLSRGIFYLSLRNLNLILYSLLAKAIIKTINRDKSFQKEAVN
ncbi:hypothetical protein CMU93_00705 [Elizabethkingia anophelis]|nr:hypothetical protein [Elizabethkingia anophelis]